MKTTKPKKEPAYVAATLRWCNARRKDQGKKPVKRLPKGERYNHASCPCGKLTGLSVGRIYFGPNKTDLPDSVQQFVDYFDEGELPQYDIAIKPKRASRATARRSPKA